MNTESESKPKPDIVYDRIQARQWFIDHPNLTVICVRRDDCEEKSCSSYAEAEAFFPVRNDGAGRY